MIFIFLSQCLSSTFLSLLIFKNKQICLFCECNNVFWLGWTVSTKTCFGLFRWRAPQEHFKCMRTIFLLVHGVVKRVDRSDYARQYPHLSLNRGSTNTYRGSRGAPTPAGSGPNNSFPFMLDSYCSATSQTACIVTLTDSKTEGYQKFR